VIVNVDGEAGEEEDGKDEDEDEDGEDEEDVRDEDLGDTVLVSVDRNPFVVKVEVRQKEKIYSSLKQ